jgi:predicted SnoaL-like aldol condensation-catalyzing enzyme
MKNKEIVRNMFRDIFEKPHLDIALIAHYFHPSYMQYVDGNILDYTTFIQHMQAIKSSVKDVKIKFEHLIAEDDMVCSVHYASGTKPNGSVVKSKIIALFKLQEGKFVLCEELTQLLQGDAEDRDMGSRH